MHSVLWGNMGVDMDRGIVGLIDATMDGKGNEETGGGHRDSG